MSVGRSSVRVSASDGMDYSNGAGSWDGRQTTTPGRAGRPTPAEGPPGLLAAFEHGGMWDAAAPSARARRRAGGRRRAGRALRGRRAPAAMVGIIRQWTAIESLRRGQGARGGAVDDPRGRAGAAAAAPPDRPARRLGRRPDLRARRRPGDGAGLGRQPRRPRLDPAARGCPASAASWPTAPSPRRRPSSSRRRSSRSSEDEAARAEALILGELHGQDLAPGPAAGLAGRPRRRPRRRRAPPRRRRAAAGPRHGVPGGVRRGRPVRPRPAHRPGPVRPRQRPGPRPSSTRRPARSPATARSVLQALAYLHLLNDVSVQDAIAFARTSAAEPPPDDTSRQDADDEDDEDPWDDHPDGEDPGEGRGRPPAPTPRATPPARRRAPRRR